MICGLILAGGRSSRFGREKAMAELDGRPLIGWVSDRLVGGVARLAVSAAAGSGAAAYGRRQGWAVLSDDAGGPGGPLAGVTAGLRFAAELGAPWLCTAPCDTPFLPMDFVARLSGGADAGGAVARTADGLQPLAALWPVAALNVVESWAAQPAPRKVMSWLGAAPVDFADTGAFANLNTPDEYAAAQDAAARRFK